MATTCMPCHKILMYVAVLITICDAALYPYGLSMGDIESEQDEYAPCEAQYNHSVQLFESQNSRVYVCTNGLISLGSSLIRHSPSPFLIQTTGAVVAVYWADGNPEAEIGTLWSRELQNTTLLNSTSEIVEIAFGIRFEASWGLMTTWSRLPAQSEDSERNTVQAIVLSDGEQTYALLIYEGFQSEEDKTQMGMAAADGFYFFTIIDSRMSSIIDIQTGSNFGMPGHWLFKLSETEIIKPDSTSLLDEERDRLQNASGEVTSTQTLQTEDTFLNITTTTTSELENLQNQNKTVTSTQSILGNL